MHWVKVYFVKFYHYITCGLVLPNSRLGNKNGTTRMGLVPENGERYLASRLRTISTIEVASSGVRRPMERQL